MPNGGIPSYVLVDSVSVKVNASQGTSSALVADIWLEAEGIDYGGYELPVAIPVLASGKTTLFLRGGILKDGRTGFRGVYPFYTLDTASTMLISKDTVQVVPSFKYVSFAQFPLIEDWEVGNSFSNLQIVTNNQVFEGSGSALMKLDVLTPEKSAKLLNAIVLPNDREAYLELNYKSNNFFNIKLEGKDANGITNTFDVIFIAPKSEWNKIYIKLTDDLNLLDAEEYKFIINAIKNDTLSTAEIYLDNFKVLHL